MFLVKDIQDHHLGRKRPKANKKEKQQVYVQLDTFRNSKFIVHFCNVHAPTLTSSDTFDRILSCFYAMEGTKQSQHLGTKFPLSSALSIPPHMGWLHQTTDLEKVNCPIYTSPIRRWKLLRRQLKTIRHKAPVLAKCSNHVPIPIINVQGFKHSLYNLDFDKHFLKTK